MPRAFRSAFGFLMLVLLVAAVTTASFMAGYAANWHSTLANSKLEDRQDDHGMTYLEAPLEVTCSANSDEEETFSAFWQGWRLLQSDFDGPRAQEPSPCHEITRPQSRGPVALACGSTIGLSESPQTAAQFLLIRTLLSTDHITFRWVESFGSGTTVVRFSRI